MGFGALAKDVAKPVAKATYQGIEDLASKIALRKSTTKPNFVSELDWSPESWFGTRAFKTYDADDVKALTSHIPEYTEIERTAKANVTWLKMPDGSTWTGDPRSWVQMHSKAFKKAGLTGTPHYSGMDLKDKLDYSPEFNGDSWADLNQGMSKNWSGIGMKTHNGHIFQLDYPASAKVYRVNARGTMWNNLPPDIFPKTPKLDERFTDDLLNQTRDNYDVTQIDNVIEGFSDSKPVDDIIIHAGTPRKSLLGNNGDFNMHNRNIYKGVIPLSIFSLGLANKQ